MIRWLAGSVVPLTLLLANVGGRLLSPTGADEDTAEMQTTLGIAATVAMVIIAIVAGTVWSMKMPTEQVVPDLGLGLLAGTVLAVFVGPLAVGLTPADFGFGMIVAQILIFYLILVIAAYIGYLITITFGIDFRSKTLRRVEKRYRRKR